MTTLGPRVVIAGTHSGVGKTSIAAGLMAALARRGVKVAAAKVGPDFIDPGYHALATGRPGRNLDPWMCGEDATVALAGRAAHDADIFIVEGVMGLFDGAADPNNGDPNNGDMASTAHVARLLDAPVVLVVDASAMARSAAAVVHGFATFDPRVRLAGVILNRVGSDSHEQMLRDALASAAVPVVGVVRREKDFAWRDRHLGLVPVVEQRDAVVRALDRLAGAVERGVRLDAIMQIAATAGIRDVEPVRLPPAVVAPGSVRVAVAGGPAFSFTYADNLEALSAAGAELLPFDPCRDAALPDGVAALYAGGGFPEVFAAELAANRPLLADVREQIERGIVVLAECGGLLWLARSLDGHQLAGVLPVSARMTERLTLGYRAATPLIHTPIAPAGAHLRGHEFHYSDVDPSGDALELAGRTGATTAGFATDRLLASYLHLHFGGDPTPAVRLVETAANPSVR